MKLIITGLILLLLCGCYTSKTANKQVHKADAFYPEITSKFCGDRYPPKIGEPEIIYVPGDTVEGKPYPVYLYDSAGNVRDSCECKDRYIRDTTIVKIPVMNEAALINREIQLAEKTTQNAVLQSKIEQKNKWIWGMGIALGAIVIALAIYIIIKIKS